ncbi:Kinase/ NEK / Serine/threonine protein kinase [Giardia duodenalis assemblage B]|uniref:Kinase/ NEK / Serine/threonine protein kinase n=1 Tax=Giardia duodenalis assemblage B TaxID=1394984 RepID=A0A132NRV7_GIAIN|nr:Kinase/ NEK / Serine/threonine protein kinase [Giardia intestinalis assemblage B]
MLRIAFANRYTVRHAVEEGNESTWYSVERKNDGLPFSCREYSVGHLDSGYNGFDHASIKELLSIVHPYILRIMEIIYDQETQKVYVITELNSHNNLRYMIDAYWKSREQIGEGTIIRIIGELAEALKYYHTGVRPGMLPSTPNHYRTLTPANVLVTKDGAYKIDTSRIEHILDPGYMAKASAKSVYTSPEVFEGANPSERSDIWSLGCIAYELATLQAFVKNPTAEDARMQVQAVLPNLRLPGYSREFADLLRRMLCVDPRSRASVTYICGLEPVVNIMSEFGYKQMAPENRAGQQEDSASFAQRWRESFRASQVGPTERKFKNAADISRNGTNASQMSMRIQQNLDANTADNRERAAYMTDNVGMYSLSVDDLISSHSNVPGVRNEPITRSSLTPAAAATLTSHVAPTYSRDATRIISSRVDSMRTGADPAANTSLNNGLSSSFRNLLEMNSNSHNCDASIDDTSPIYNQNESNVRTAADARNAGDTNMTNMYRDELVYRRRQSGGNASGNRSSLSRVAGDAGTYDAKDSSFGDNSPFRSDQIDSTVEQLDHVIAQKNEQNRFPGVPVQTRTSKMINIGQGIQSMVYPGQAEGITSSKILNSTYFPNFPGQIAQFRAAYDSRVTPEDENMHITDPDGTTPLMKAVIRDDMRLIQKYLPTQCRIANDRGVTALMLAAYFDNFDAIQMLLDKESKTQDAAGMTALMYAAHKGNTSSVVQLYTHEARMVTGKGVTALMIAAECGWVDVVRTLMPREARLRDDFGNTALIYACKAGRASVVQELLEYEAGLKNNDEWTALMISAKMGFVQITNLLLERECKFQTKAGLTALMIAAANNRPDIANSLLKDEACMRDLHEETAMMKAAALGAYDVVKVLMDSEGGARRPDGKTALMCAADAGYVDIVSSLMNRESRMRKNDGTTALMYATERGHTECVRLLVETEKCIQRQNGETALMIAVCRGLVDCVKILADYEISVSLPDGTSVMDIASQAGNQDVIRCLRAYV